MIIVSEEDWSRIGNDDTGNSLVTGAAAPVPLGTLRPSDYWPLTNAVRTADDPVTKTEAIKANAQRALDLMLTTTSAGRALDRLVIGILDATDWREGLMKFDKGSAELKQKDLARFKHDEDRAVFARDIDELATMRRIDLKHALASKQQAEAIAALAAALNYYAERATTARNDVLREIAIERGTVAIDRMRDAGYLFPETAEKLAAQFHARVDLADDRLPPTIQDYDEAWKDWVDNNIEQNEIVPPNKDVDPGINVGIPPRSSNPGVPQGQPNPPAPIKSQDI